MRSLHWISVTGFFITALLSCELPQSRASSTFLQTTPQPPASSTQPDSLEQSLLAEGVPSLVAAVQAQGDPARGAWVYYRSEANCAKCHEPMNQQRRLGPDLAQIREATLASLIEAVLQPSAQIREGYETCLVLLSDGRQLQGIVAGEDAEQLLLDRIEEPGKPNAIPLDEIEDRRNLSLSTMPAGIVNTLGDRQSFLDLIRFLDEAARFGPTRVVQLRPINALDPAPPLPAYESQLDHRGLIASWDANLLEQGADIYRLRCASCHGDLEQEGSMPTSLRFASGKFKRGSDPWSMYQTLTHGYGMMNAQRWMVPQQKYAVIHYIRETFIKPHNPSQYQEITAQYLTSLPAGTERGPKPAAAQPWSAMDYGPILFNTLAVTADTQNIAQKGIIVRLDEGPGGVAAGSYWALYEHDTMRLAAVWRGDFIDYNGIHFNGVHGQHPHVTGQILWQNDDRPGWAHPQTQTFDDERLVGRDGRRFGPLPATWLKYRGLHRFGQQAMLEYTIGTTAVREMPGLSFVGPAPIVSRYLEFGPREKDLVVRVAQGAMSWQQPTDGVIGRFTKESANTNTATSDASPSLATGSAWYQLKHADVWNTFDQDFTITATVSTASDGTLWAKTRDQENWLPQGQSLFIRDGRLTFDIGWVGAVQSNRRITDNRPHEIAMTWSAADHRIAFFVDGKPAGGGVLKPAQPLTESVFRIGYTQDNFPETSQLQGELSEFCFFQRQLEPGALQQLTPELRQQANLYIAKFAEQTIDSPTGADPSWTAQRVAKSANRTELAGWWARARFSDGLAADDLWTKADDGQLYLKIPAGTEPLRLEIAVATIDSASDLEPLSTGWSEPFHARPLPELEPLTLGGPAQWPNTWQTKTEPGEDREALAVDVLAHPSFEESLCRMRMTGLDFLNDPDHSLVVATWDGNIWQVKHAAQFVAGTESNAAVQPLVWRRIAAGLFQPLGICYRQGVIYVTCRDQLVALHDRNRDGEIDWYQCFNSDHQVTEHFHEFAMGLQMDAAGNFYYAKSARHALPALVPHHGTLLKVAADGSRTEILATGFRAANGVCINPDGTFFVTDQEGHWTPKNRINRVRPGGFYGNMWGYHDITDTSDSAMEPPLCWITNAMDRSPAELVWVDRPEWGTLNGALLGFSYGYGRVYVVPHEATAKGYQGGICELPIPAFATGIMRGRFDTQQGHLYGCGMFAWSSTQEQPGGLYRIRRTTQPVHVPIGLQAHPGSLDIRFSEPWQQASAEDPRNYRMSAWSLRRSAQYGSEHHDEHELAITAAELLDDGRTVRLTIPQLHPADGLELVAVLQTPDGRTLTRKIHLTIHELNPVR